MKVVLDTNVIVSAFLSPLGKPSAILKLVLRGDYEMCYSTAILAEYEQVLYRSKFTDRIQQPSIQRFFEIINEIGTNVICSISKVKLPDETDREFYDVVKTADAVLITGNKKHYPDEVFIMNPDEFLSKY